MSKKFVLFDTFGYYVHFKWNLSFVIPVPGQYDARHIVDRAFEKAIRRGTERSIDRASYRIFQYFRIVQTCTTDDANLQN